MLQTAITDHAKSGFGLAPNKKPNGTASRSSRPEVFCKQGVLKNCKIHGKESISAGVSF